MITPKTIALALLLALPAFAEDLDYAQFNTGTFAFPHSSTNNYSTNSLSQQISFDSYPGYFTVTAITTAPTWGLGGGYFPAAPTGVDIDPLWVSPAFTSQHSVDGLSVLSFAGAPNATTLFALDFSTLDGGYLPAGSVIAWGDVDGGEKASLYAGGVDNWYSLAPENFHQAGITVGQPYNTGQPEPTPADMPTTQGSNATTLVLNGPGTPVTDSVTNFIFIQKAIQKLFITSTGSPNTHFTQTFAVATSTSAVPEPTSGILVMLAGGLLLRRRR